MIGDVSAVNPGGVRLGTPAMTTRGMNEDDMDKVSFAFYMNFLKGYMYYHISFYLFICFVVLIC